ncbi:MAG: sodium:proton antiporter [Sphingobacteriaceae bacterium]|nr:sodium:proton antiporter [Sphingobacteriaceae bacterium]
MDVIQIITILIGICAAFSYLNTRFLKFPPSVGIMLIALIFSILLLIEGHASSYFHDLVKDIVAEVNFPHILLDVMLGFLLFAGSLHVNFNALKKQGPAITIFSTLGVMVSTFLFGTIFYFLLDLVSLHIDYMYCILFGSLISPTDPIAVLGILKKCNVPKEIEVLIEGESLFNDGIGVVLFLTLMQVVNSGIENFSGLETAGLFAREVFGGLLLGFLHGYIVFYFIKKIDNYHTVVLMSLAFVMVTGQLAKLFHVSGPLATIVVGLMVGNKAHKFMSVKTKDYHDKFWELLDDLLNAMLFVLIGLQMVMLPFLLQYLEIGILSIFLLIACRFVSLRLPMLFLKNKLLYNKNTALIMTWGGLRGGLSIALTLSLPDSPFNETIIAITYMIVIFSILIQALTTERVVKSLLKIKN